MKSKFLYLLILLLSSVTGISQVTTKIQADSVRIFQIGSNSELILENGTKGNTNAFLQNWNNGRTKFAFALDSVWLAGGSLYFRRGSLTSSYPIRNGIDSIHISGDSIFQYIDGIAFFKGMVSPGSVAGKLNTSDTATMLNPYLRKADTTNKWISHLNAAISGGALNVTSSISAPGGSLNFTWQGLSSQYVRGNGSLSTFSTDVQSVANPLYAPLSHTQPFSTITDGTTAVRNLLSAGSGISYNTATGVIAATGTTSVAWGSVTGTITDQPDLFSTFYSKTNLQTSGQASVHWDNLTNVPSIMTNPMTSLGEIIYGGSSGTATRLAGNTTTTKKFFTQTGTGTGSAIPGWNSIAAGDLPDLSATYQPRLSGTGFIKATGTTISYDNNAYTVANGAITGATKAKITYDTKGLVTAGADLIEADIPALSESKITSLTSDLAAKQGTITLTTTGISGASTLVGNTLNIPLYGSGTGTVNSGTQYRLGYYANTGTSLSEAAAITASRALVSDPNGIPTHSPTTATQLGYLSTATSDVQTQINGKQTTVSTTDNNLSFNSGTGILATNKAVQSLTDGATIAFNAGNGYNAKVTLGGNRTLSITNAQQGDYLSLDVYQNAVGGKTLTFPANSVFLNSDTISTAANSLTVCIAKYDGTNFIWTLSNGSASTGIANVSFYEWGWKVGADVSHPVDGDSTWTEDSLVNRKIDVFREGELQFFNDQYLFDSATGKITFRPVLSGNERIIIKSYNSNYWTRSYPVVAGGPSLEAVVFNVLGTGLASDGSGNYPASGPGFGHTGLENTKKLPAGSDGYLEFNYSAGDCDFAIAGFSTANSIITGYSDADFYAVFTNSGNLSVIAAGTNTGVGPTITSAAGKKLRIERVGTTLYAKYYDGTSWSTFYTFSGTFSGDLYPSADVQGSSVLRQPKAYGLQ